MPKTPKTPKGYSLHVGLNRTSFERYPDGRYPTLFGCDKAAKAMAKIAKERGFDVSPVVEKPEDLTHDCVANWLRDAGKKAVPGDIVLLTFAGHGDDVKDRDGDEPRDQALVLYDSLLIDDEIYELLQAFSKDVRVVFVADCCYGGTIIAQSVAGRRAATVARASESPSKPTDKGPAFLRANVHADVLLLSACKDTSRTEAAQSPGNLPPFTGRIVAAFDRRAGDFPKGYPQLMEALGPEAWLESGLLNDPNILDQQPFSI